MSRHRACFAAQAAVVVAAVAAALPAHADGPPPMRRAATVDAYPYTPPPEQLFYNWSGFYLGGHLGGTWGETGGSLTTGATEPMARRSNDFLGGAQAGYMHQFRELVLGAEVKYSWTGTEFGFASTATPGLNVTTRVNDITTVTGRVGYAYMNMLAYWKAGWASGEVETSASGVNTGSLSTRSNGWVAGGGVSYAFGPNIIGGVEYDYVHLSSPGGALVPGVATVASSGLDVQSVTLRLDFKFGH